MRPLPPAFVVSRQLPFERLVDGWFPLTYALNNLTRGLGLADAYPFVLSPRAIDKLRFVHEVIAASAVTSEPAPDPALAPAPAADGAITNGAAADRS